MEKERYFAADQVKGFGFKGRTRAADNGVWLTHPPSHLNINIKRIVDQC